MGFGVGMKPDYIKDKVRLFNCDCMNFMKEIPDNYYELAIVDPPYFDKANNPGYFGADYSSIGVRRRKYGIAKVWKKPDEKYFRELLRVSKNQIIWGINYYPVIKDLGSGRIIWDKVKDQTTFSKAEIAFCSMIDSVNLFRYKWNGMLQQDMFTKEVKIHPTQKPVALYRWLLTNYAKQGNKIFDSHGGSFSSACACLDLGFEFDGCELDKDYFKSACDRLDNHNQMYLDI